jgi:hypothetical protein
MWLRTDWRGQNHCLYVDLTRTGFCVEFGCHHPFRGSNTLSLYSRGWYGVVVDGNPDLIALFRRLRPRDTAICAVVSNKELPVTFTLANQRYVARRDTQLRSRHRPRTGTTPIESPQSNGMAEAFVRTIKRDYVLVSPCPDAQTVMNPSADYVQ